MAKYGFSTAIPYGLDIFEVTGGEYCEWEDALESASSANGRDWATYDFLISKGYFVSAPNEPRDSVDDADRSKAARKNGAVSSPQIRDLDGLGGSVISGNTREPAWSQSQILNERSKLLNEREAFFKKKEEQFKSKLVSYKRNDTFYTIEGNKYTNTDWADSIAGLIIACFIVFLAVAMCR